MKTIAALLSASLFLLLNVSPAAAGRHVRSRAAQRSKPTAGSQSPISELRKINETRLTGVPGWQHAPLVFDERYAYLGTPNGLYRTTRWLSPERPFEQFRFAGKEIINLYLFKNELYVLKRGEYSPSGPATDHTFLKSSDHAESFAPLDGGLSECVGGNCGYLEPAQALFKDDLIFLTAGGGSNLFVSPDGGRRWSVLSGSVNSQTCYHPAFELVGHKILIGGECPLDFAYLRSGTLRADFLGWQDTNPGFKPIAVEDMSNRNVQFIKQRPNTSTVFVGVEGGLLKSDDNGQSFRFVIKHAQGGGGRKYPYITSILFPSLNGDIILVSGYDNAAPGGGYLAYSKDGGETWIDISELVLAPDFRAYNVPVITEDLEGRVIAVIVRNSDPAAWSVVTAEVAIGGTPAIPTLLTEEGTARAIALDSVTLQRGPFPLLNSYNFSPDGRTRIMLFARNVRLLPGEDASAVAAQAEVAGPRVYALPVEYAAPVRNFEWLTQVVVRIPDALAGAGEVQVSIGYRGMTSNKASVNIRSSEASASP